MKPPSITVRCPSCDGRVQTTPEVRAVVRTPGEITVQYETTTVTHWCRDAPPQVGFASTRKENP